MTLPKARLRREPSTSRLSQTEIRLEEIAAKA